MFADVQRWGNSLAIRIPSREAEALGIQEGDQVKVRLERLPRGKVDLSGLPLFRDPDRRASVHHDRYIAEALEEKLRRTRRRARR